MIETLKEFWINETTKEIIKDALTGTISKIKFVQKISQSCIINTELSQEDRISLTLFTPTMAKIIRE